MDLVEIDAGQAFRGFDIVFLFHLVITFPTIRFYFCTRIDMGLEDGFQFLSRIVVDGQGIEPFDLIVIGKLHRTDYLFLFGIVTTALFALFLAPNGKFVHLYLALHGVVAGRFHCQTDFLHEIPGRFLADTVTVRYLDTGQTLTAGTHLIDDEEGLSQPEPDPMEQGAAGGALFPFAECAHPVGGAFAL